MLATIKASWYNKGGKTKIETFTYKDYLNYQKFLEKNQGSKNKLQENSEPYTIENQQINHEHDKIFRLILDDKKEATKFLNKVLGTKLQEEQLEKYNSSFVTLELRNQESDIIYKMKKQNIFFLIEHQTKIDYTMPFRILEYEYEIIKSAIDKNRIGRKGYKFSKVISIVLYSGRTKWKVEDYIQKVQEELVGYKGLEFARYNIVDINDYSEKELLEEESFLSKAMLIEKARYSNNLRENIEKIVEELNQKRQVYSKEQREILITIINLVLRTKLDKEVVEKSIKSLQEGEETMLAVLEMLEEENKRIFKKGERAGREAGEVAGEKKAKKETAKKMLEEKIPMKTIIKVTGLKENEISKLKQIN